MRRGPRRPLGGPAPRVDRRNPVPGKLDELNGKIDRTRDRIGRKKGAEKTLSSDIAQYTRRINRLQAKITTLAGREEVLQRDLDAKRAELESLRGELRSERARLVRLQRRLREARATLSTRLVELFKADKPDILTVVLGSTDFADLLERTEFIRRISDQDRQSSSSCATREGDAVDTEARLAKLESASSRRSRRSCSRGATRSPRCKQRARRHARRATRRRARASPPR